MRILKAGNKILTAGGRVLKTSVSSSVTFPAVIPLWYCKADDNMNDSVGTNHGTNVGAVSYVTGLINKAARYSSPTKYTTFSPLGIIGTASWTFCCRVKLTSAALNCVMGFGQEAATKGVFAFINNGLVKFDYYGSGAYVSSVSTVNSGTWRYIAYKFDGVRSYVYVDGAMEASRNTYAPNLGNNYFWIANCYSASGGSTMNGDMDEMYFFNSALSDADILSIKLAGDAGLTYN